MTLLRTKPLLVIGLMLGAGLISFFIFRQSSDAAPIHKVTEPLVSLSQAPVKSVATLGESLLTGLRDMDPDCCRCLLYL